MVSKIMSVLTQIGWHLVSFGLGVAATYLFVRWKKVELKFQRAEYRYDAELVRDRIWARFEIRPGRWASTSQVEGVVAPVQVFDEQGRRRHSAPTIWSIGGHQARLAEFTGRETVLVFELLRRPQEVRFCASTRTPDEGLQLVCWPLEDCADWTVNVTVTSPSTSKAAVIHTVREFLRMACDPDTGRPVVWSWPSPRDSILGEGELFRYTGEKIYLWTGEVMRHIETPDVFYQAGCRLADVWKVSHTWWRNREKRSGEPIRDAAELEGLVRSSQ